MRNAFTLLRLLPRRAAVALIRGYQMTLSPDHGPLRHIHRYGFCRHTPSCSEYARIVTEREGVIRGTVLSAKRLFSCHPWKEPSREKIMEVCHGPHS